MSEVSSMRKWIQETVKHKDMAEGEAPDTAEVVEVTRLERLSWLMAWNGFTLDIHATVDDLDYTSNPRYGLTFEEHTEFVLHIGFMNGVKFAGGSIDEVRNLLSARVAEIMRAAAKPISLGDADASE